MQRFQRLDAGPGTPTGDCNGRATARGKLARSEVERAGPASANRSFVVAALPKIQP